MDKYKGRYVYAMRIFLQDGYRPMAELAFGDGGRPNGETITIPYDNVDERNKYVINSYTFVWDEREAVKTQTFEEYISQ